MTQNAWNTDFPNADGETIIGNTSNPAASTTLTAGGQAAIVNSAGGIEIQTAPISDWVIIQQDTASSTAFIDYTCRISDFELLVLVGDNQLPASSTGLGVSVSTDGGATFDSTASNYQGSGWEMSAASYTGLDDTSMPGGKLQILGSTTEPSGTSANQIGSFIIKIFKPSNSQWTKSVSYSYYVESSGDTNIQYWGTFHKSTTAINALRLKQTSGNIAQGNFVLYGATT